MRSLSNTINRLATLRARAAPSGLGQPSARLTRLEDFGTNPGALHAWCHLPDDLEPGAPLVVVLHGCTQDAAGYDRGSGWSQLADEQGFALLLPEQTRANNANLCFNWFDPQDSRRDSGEPLSIKQMIDAMVERHGLDRGRIFVTGLSAGGAMASVMLATYPELFAGGAIIAGLPYGSARTIPEAFDRMRGHGSPGGAALAASIRSASPHKGPWPSIAVWHGSADRTVDASNGAAIVEQWRQVHGVAAEPSKSGTVDGYPYRAWRDTGGRVVIEDYAITGMGHGTPLSAMGEEGVGESGAYMLEVAISSTRHIAKSWGLGGKPREVVEPGKVTKPGKIAKPRAPDRAAAEDRAPPKMPLPAGVGKIIEDALRAAGLMR